MPDDILRKIRDPARLAELQATGLLDSPAEESFDRITRLAMHFVGAPVGLINLIDADRQYSRRATGRPRARCR
jgi:hypothetical protein